MALAALTNLIRQMESKNVSQSQKTPAVCFPWSWATSASAERQSAAVRAEEPFTASSQKPFMVLSPIHKGTREESDKDSINNGGHRDGPLSSFRFWGKGYKI